MIKPEDIIQLSRPEAFSQAREINEKLSNLCDCTCHKYTTCRNSTLDYHVDAPILNE